MSLTLTINFKSVMLYKQFNFFVKRVKLFTAVNIAKPQLNFGIDECFIFVIAFLDKSILASYAFYYQVRPYNIAHIDNEVLFI